VGAAAAAACRLSAVFDWRQPLPSRGVWVRQLARLPAPSSSVLQLVSCCYWRVGTAAGRLASGVWVWRLAGWPMPQSSVWIWRLAS